MLSPESQADRFLLFCDEIGLPPPSLIVSSGRGLQCKWLLTSALPGGGALARWRAVQDEIFTALKPLGADGRARSPSQILRVPGTVNSKTGGVVRVLHRNTTPTHGGELLRTGVVGYNFEVLAGELLPVPRIELQASKAATAATRAKAVEEAAEVIAGRVIDVAANSSADPAKKYRTGAQRRYWASYKDLPRDRLRDLYKLAKMRYPSGAVPAGKRDTFIFIAACFLVGCCIPADLEGEIRDAAAKLSPMWTDAQVRGCVSSVLARSLKHLAGELAEFNGKPVPQGYRWKNQTLLEWLEVTAEEETQLQTIISKAEVRRRKRDKARNAARADGVQARAEYRAGKVEKTARALALKDAGRSVQEIANTLGVSRRTVQAYCASGKSGGVQSACQRMGGVAKPARGAPGVDVPLGIEECVSPKKPPCPCLEGGEGSNPGPAGPREGEGEGAAYAYVTPTGLYNVLEGVPSGGALLVEVPELPALLEKAGERGNSALVMQLVQRAAKKCGGVFTNRREFMGKGGAPIARVTQVELVSPQALAEAGRGDEQVPVSCGLLGPV